MYRLLLISLLSLILIAPVHAQYDNTSLESDISISVTPANPEPGQSIVLEVTSYVTDVTQATVTWRYNGTIIASGSGKNRISSTAPKSGAPAIISATVSGGGLSTGTTAITLRSASIDLLWEAVDSYTPPFYKGKALLSPNGTVRATAITSSTAPKNLSYEWSQNDSIVANASGYNKTSMVFKNDSLKSQERIGVSAASGSFSGADSITVTPGNPKILAYQNKEGFIDYTRGYDTGLSTSAAGITLRFEPYFFSVPSSIDKNLEFEIENGDTIISPDKTINEISLSAPESRGESMLSLTVHTVLYSLQNAVSRFKILFN